MAGLGWAHCKHLLSTDYGHKQNDNHEWQDLHCRI